ncbi:Cas8a1 family CRISPR/Cas system-associated protein [uncultured Brachyspira sp.]|uniref:Cas8a1 family CRISPR/Cas system-associated protein n=1 Tax=uncultured Brachyspira sp. TaxID=221953 RepID=UPI00260DFFB0|nr:Cas8a1 family CRISPR/Cas system-associated protein [uncultured Brachyspira sp.]
MTKTKKSSQHELNLEDNQNNNLEEEYFEINLDTFLFNAGIIGFIEVLEEAKASKGESLEDRKDFYYEGQTLYVNKIFIKNKIYDITNSYIAILLKKFQTSTSIYKLCNLNIEKINKDNIDYYYKIFDGKYVNTVCNILNDNKFMEIIKSRNNIKKNKKLDKEDKFEEELKLLATIIEYLNDIKNIKLKKYLTISQIALNKMKLIYYNILFLQYFPQQKGYSIRRNIDFFESIKIDLIEKNIDYIKLKNNNKSYKYSNCIICDRNISSNDKIKISFLVSSVEDMSKKTSVYWNKKPDTYICPICNMIYICSIIGFNSTNNGIIFANSNDSISSLIDINKSFETKLVKINIINLIMNKILELKTLELNSIQIISKIQTNKYYSIEIITKDILNIIYNCKKELNTLSKIKPINLFDNKKNKINIFDECLKNIFNYCNHYNLIHNIIASFLSEKNPTMNINYLYSLLKIQIKQQHYKGGYKMTDNEEKNNEIIGKAKRARKAGYKLKKDLGDPKEADNKIKGFVYQLLNSVQVGNIDTFYSTVIRIYVSNDLKIPKIISEASNIKDFKEIGYAFILGLKSQDYKKGVKNE